MLQKIFEIKDAEPVITETGLMVPEFKIIADTHPEQAQEYFQYVYHMVNPLSPYYDYGPEKESEIIKAYIDSDGKWRPIPMIKKAVERYGSFRTAEQRLLDGAQAAVDKLAEYLRDIDLYEEDEMRKPKHSSRQIVQNLNDMGKLVTSLSQLRDAVKKGMQELGQDFYGGAELNMFDEQDL